MKEGRGSATEKTRNQKNSDQTNQDTYNKNIQEITKGEHR